MYVERLGERSLLAGKIVENCTPVFLRQLTRETATVRCWERWTPEGCFFFESDFQRRKGLSSGKLHQRFALNSPRKREVRRNRRWSTRFQAAFEQGYFDIWRQRFFPSITLFHFQNSETTHWQKLTKVGVPHGLAVRSGLNKRIKRTHKGLGCMRYLCNSQNEHGEGMAESK